MKKGRSIEFKALGPSGGPELFSLFRTCFGHEIDEAWWRWKYNPPHGRAKNLIALVDGKVAAHYGAYPLKIVKDGQNYHVHHIGDVMVAPEFRGLGVGKSSLIHLLTRNFYDRCCRGVAFNYGCPSERHARLGRALLDYEILDPITVWELDLEGFSPRSICKLLERPLSKQLKFIPTPVGSEVVRLFQSVAPYFPMVIVKDEAHLGWRYQEKPGADYFSYGMYLFNHLRIWAVLRYQNNTIELGELVFRKNDWLLLPLFIERLRARFNQAKRLILWCNPHLKWPTILYERLGLECHPHPLRIYFTVTRFKKDNFPKEAIRRGLHYSFGDFDLF